MNTTKPTNARPQLETLACVNERCELYGQKGQNNLTIRKRYGRRGYGIFAAEDAERNLVSGKRQRCGIRRCQRTRR